jgi:hypothetical protein
MVVEMGGGGGGVGDLWKHATDECNGGGARRTKRLERREEDLTMQHYSTSDAPLRWLEIDYHNSLSS